MDIPKNVKKVVVIIGPSDNPYAKILLPEKRKGLKDRRKIHTYVAKDRRSGIVERRKPVKFIHLGGGDNLLFNELIKG